MSIVKSYAVGAGDMFYIRHNTDNFTIIDCCGTVTKLFISTKAVLESGSTSAMSNANRPGSTSFGQIPGTPISRKR